MSANQPWCTQNGRKNNFDFFRFLLANLVIFSHCYPLLYGEAYGNTIEPFMLMTRQQMTAGGVAVSFFFILSGYLITQSWLTSSGFFDFMIKRTLRIFPGFVVASLVCLLIVAPLGSPDPKSVLMSFNPFQFIWHQVLLYLPGIAGVFPNNPVEGAINGSAWTVRYEFWCYLLLAALGMTKLLQKKTVAVFFSLSGFVYLLLYTHIIPDRLPFENGRTFLLIGEFKYHVQFIYSFLAGVSFYIYRDKIPFSQKLFHLLLGILIISCILGVGFVFLFPICSAYVIMFLGFHPKLNFSGFARRGDISYGTYLYAYPVQQLLIVYLQPWLNPLTFFFLAFAITFVLAIISWFGVERPFLRLKSRKREFRNIPKLISDKDVQTGV